MILPVLRLPFYQQFLIQKNFHRSTEKRRQACWLMDYSRALCMRNDQCIKVFPFIFRNKTIIDGQGCPKYQHHDNDSQVAKHL